MLVIRRTKTCLLGSSTDEEDEKHKCSTDTSHAPPEEAQPQPELEVEADNTAVEELQPDETQEDEPNESEPELEDASIHCLHEPDGNNLSVITEMLGAESGDGEMVKELSEAVTEWSWTYKHQRERAIEAEMLAQRTLPPPLPRYVGRPYRFLKVERCGGRIRMNEVEMDRPPQALRIVRENGRIRMQLMTYLGDPREVEEACQETTSEDEEEPDVWDPNDQKQLFVTAA